ncbi:hypothetical protein PHYPO_G00148870 [Pangasianodon hypophthalmus]|uniref:Uncharacterized protein n=1 Tax=Pangasianodon hypophthalmus TaxID=310915 RepID=A0A5N5K3Y7_PANHP|nr:hypothetical protein PHYPO_G00148870 [Pangasianodon hypophthalmus]
MRKAGYIRSRWSLTLKRSTDTTDTERVRTSEGWLFSSEGQCYARAHRTPDTLRLCSSGTSLSSTSWTLMGRK